MQDRRHHCSPRGELLLDFLKNLGMTVSPSLPLLTIQGKTCSTTCPPFLGSLHTVTHKQIRHPLCPKPSGLTSIRISLVSEHSSKITQAGQVFSLDNPQTGFPVLLVSLIASLFKLISKDKVRQYLRGQSQMPQRTFA